MTRRYVLLPTRGVRATEQRWFLTTQTIPPISSLQQSVSVAFNAAPGEEVRVIDTTQEDGPKLVELSERAADALNAPGTGVRAEPEVVYGLPDTRPQPLGGATAALASATTTVRITCLDAHSALAVPGVRVVAFTDFTKRVGDEGDTDAAGTVTLHLASAAVERLYAYAPAGHWGAFRTALSAAAPITLMLEPVDLSFVDAVRSYYGRSHFDPSRGVTVGVLDTGVGPYSDLNIVAGVNTVTGELATDYEDIEGHGTHVAGLIGSNGAPPTGLRGVAPGISVRVYRVFGTGGQGATNYAIVKALIRAAGDCCDIVNLSLGGGPYDRVVEEAIRDAREQGMLTVIATGNDGRGVISYPAAYQYATPVSAMGYEGTYPTGSVDEASVLRPPSSTADAKEFIADFSNIGKEVFVTGPGVGVLSTLPHNTFGPMSGTSMAAPVVSGAAACLLSRNPAVFGMPRDRARGDAIEALLAKACTPRGFGSIYEGRGLPDPATI
jgi:subtilisin